MHCNRSSSSKRLVIAIIVTWGWALLQHCDKIICQEFCMKPSLSFPFYMYAGRNSSKVSIKNHFIWEGKDLKTLFHFALSIGTRFHSFPNNRAQWSICECTLYFINKSDSIRDKSTVPWGWDQCTVKCLYEYTPTISLKKSELTDIMGSCDQGRIRLSTQFLNFSVAINHLCLEQCFLFTSKQVPADRLSISLPVLQHTPSRIHTWAASKRDALPPSLSHKVNVPFVQLSFPATAQQGSPKGPVLRASSFLDTGLHPRAALPALSQHSSSASLDVANTCSGALPRSQLCPASWWQESRAQGVTLLKALHLSPCSSQVLCWRYPSSCLHWAELINNTPLRAGGGQGKAKTETECSWWCNGSSLADAFGG